MEEIVLDRQYNTHLNNLEEIKWLREELKMSKELNNKLEAQDFILTMACYAQELIKMELMKKLKEKHNEY